MLSPVSRAHDVLIDAFLGLAPQALCFRLLRRPSDEMPSKEHPTPPGAQPPEETSPVQIKPISKVAGGIPAIIATVKHAWGEMGAVRGSRTLLRLNQKGEFDCPGCAWPEPDG